jgi:hypothetical protein
MPQCALYVPVCAMPRCLLAPYPLNPYPQYRLFPCVRHDAPYAPVSVIPQCPFAPSLLPYMPYVYLRCQARRLPHVILWLS